jgi:tetratricopeptide (TPR) repeat protein
MTTSSAESPKIFISYTHDSPEHVDRVLSLADRLLQNGVDAHLDQYETSPPEGWPRWMNRQIEEADYVLVVCTEVYQRRFKGAEEAGKGLGAQWEGAIITQELYDAAANNKKFIPVLFASEDSNKIPRILRGAQYYDLSSEEGYTELYRRLTNQPRVSKPELGTLVPLPTRERKQFFFDTGQKQSFNSWNIPYTPNQFFTGREDVLRQLHEALETKGTAAVSGMPGMGKTQTAVEYAHRHRSDYRLILWARADTRETLISDFVNIAGTLQLPEVRAQEQNLAVGAVRRWFDANPDWLLILDNADDLSLAREFIPPAPKGHIILTTRAQATGAIATNVDVRKMEAEEGALFLLRRAKILAEDATLEAAAEEDRKKAVEISKEVDGLPLALDQAGAFIEETPSSPAEYLQLYRTQGATLRSERGENITGHPESVAITFSLSFEKVSAANPTAADLLRACAFLAPDAIPEETFTKGGARLGDLLAATVDKTLAFLNVLKETRRYSLLLRDTDAHTLSIHRVVQDVLKDAMDESTQRQWAERVVKAVNQVLPDFDEVDISEWHRFERLLPHAQSCAELIKDFELKIPKAAQLLNSAGRYIHNRGRLTEAEPYYIQALAIRQDLFGQGHPDVATSLYNLGWLRGEQGKYAEAESLFLKALDIRISQSGSDDITVAIYLSRMGWLKHAQGKYAEAKNYLYQSIEMLERTSLFDTVQMSQSLQTLASVLMEQGKAHEAETLYLRALDIKKRIHGEEHVKTALLLGALGGFYEKKGEHTKAESFLLSAIKTLEKNYDVNYPALSTILDSLVHAYMNQNRLSEAEALSDRAIGIARNAFGEESHDAGVMLGTAGTLHYVKGDFNRAEKLFQRSLNILEKVLSEEHPTTATALANLAVISIKQREYIKAEQLLRRAIAVWKKTLPQEHPSLLDGQKMYAELLRMMGRKDAAQRLETQINKTRGKKGRKKSKK